MNLQNWFNKNRYVVMYIIIIVFGFFVLMNIALQIKRAVNVNNNKEIAKITSLCVKKICINNQYCFDSFKQPQEVIIYKERVKFTKNVWVIDIETKGIRCQ